jgi:hypothetical protein
MLSRSRRRLSRRPVVETLEGRLVLSSLPDIAVLATTAQDARDVSVTFRVQNAPVPNPFELAIDRSNINGFNASTIKIGDASIGGASLSVGTHTVSIAVPSGLVIDPSHPFVIAQANPSHAVAESNYTDNSASFRVYTIGAVTHGFYLNLTAPQWVTDAANGLKADGYDVAIPFSWARTSALPVPGLAVVAGQNLANQIDAAVETLPAGAVIDLHLIGHSRGAAVIDQALLDLQSMARSGSHPELHGMMTGFTEMTFLDPHPAIPAIGNVANPYYSASTGAFGALALRGFNKTQAAINDPDITIPPGVGLVQEFYQHTSVTRGADLSEQFFNVWGEAPIAGVNQYYDVTSLTNGHRQVPGWYVQNVIPLLKTGATTIPGLIPTSTPTAAPATPTTGASYEIGVLETLTDSPSVATQLESLMASAHSAYAGGHPLIGAADLAVFTAYVQLERGRHISASGATQLTEIAGALLLTNS